MRITKRDRRTNLEKEIDRVLEEMSKLLPDSSEYKTIGDNLEKLYKAKGESDKLKVKPDTIILVVGNLLGIVLILGYEQTNIITSKALNLVIKGRV